MTELSPVSSKLLDKLTFSELLNKLIHLSLVIWRVVKVTAEVLEPNFTVNHCVIKFKVKKINT